MDTSRIVAVCSEGTVFRKLQQKPPITLELRKRRLRLERQLEKLNFFDGSVDQGLVYIASENNPAYLGPASEAEIAKHIATAKGPSGHNDEYLLELANALRELSAEDEHVFSIERHLLALS